MSYSETLENKSLHWEVIKFIIFLNVILKRKKNSSPPLKLQTARHRAEEPAAAVDGRVCSVYRRRIPNPNTKTLRKNAAALRVSGGRSRSRNYKGSPLKLNPVAGDSTEPLLVHLSRAGHLYPLHGWSKVIREAGPPCSPRSPGPSWDPQHIILSCHWYNREMFVHKNPVVFFNLPETLPG